MKKPATEALQEPEPHRGQLFGHYDLYLTPTTAQPPSRIGAQDTALLDAIGSRALARWVWAAWRAPPPG